MQVNICLVVSLSFQEDSRQNNGQDNECGRGQRETAVAWLALAGLASANVLRGLASGLVATLVVGLVQLLGALTHNRGLTVHSLDHFAAKVNSFIAVLDESVLFLEGIFAVQVSVGVANVALGGLDATKDRAKDYNV